jgi:hypothetical protein
MTHGTKLLKMYRLKQQKWYVDRCLDKVSRFCG